MKISEKWLREFSLTELSRKEISERLTMLGLEVDSVSPVSSMDLSGIVLGKIVGLENHKDSTNLKICQVDVGNSNPVTVVCGAPKIVEGSLVAYAPIGSNLGRVEIKKRKFRGVESDGMLCSREDLGLEEKSDELLTIPVNCASEGQLLEEVLGLPDFVFDFDLTPNRGDCFSVLGISRELSCLGGEMRFPEINPAEISLDETLSVEIESLECCPIYAGRVIRDVCNTVETPVYISERLSRSGVRPINPVVDITNYVMLEIGQPMHAFDYLKIDGGIVVRKARNKERLELLDGRIIELPTEALVIADHLKPIALAGVMGGIFTGVLENSTDVFLEAAYFDPIGLAGVARKFGLQTDASTRFERGVDPNLHKIAIERATHLICEACGGRPGPIVITGSSHETQSKETVQFRPESVNKRLGTNLSEEDILETLRSLQFEVNNKSAGPWEVCVPSFRFDIGAEVDLLEEVARVTGYDNIPAELPQFQARPSLHSDELKTKDALRQGFVWRSYTEVVTYSFVSSDKGRLLGNDDLVVLTNPISSEMEVMRPNLLSSLVYPMIHNFHRQKDELRLFEIGKVFRREGNKIVEELHAGCLRFGPLFEKQWDLKPKESDFFDIKGDMNSILSPIFEIELEVTASGLKGLHPGQSASVFSNGVQIGLLGALHPGLVRKLGLMGEVLFFEVNLDVIRPAKPKEFRPISKFPSVMRDISIVVDENVSAQNCLSIIRNLDLPILRDLQLFDLYRGQGIDSLKKSFSIGLIFQSSWSTLTDEEVDNTVGVILKSLEKEIGAILRK